MKQEHYSKMLKDIKINISNLRKKRYQKILIKKKDILLRDKAIKIIFSLDITLNRHKNYCESCLFYSKNLNKKNFISFYKKFNSHIVLKADYDPVTLIKKTNKEACLNSYFIFSKFLIKNKKINNLQKLNTILKINDLYILKFEKKHIKLIKFFKKNIHYERKLLDLYND